MPPDDFASSVLSARGRSLIGHRVGDVLGTSSKIAKHATSMMSFDPEFFAEFSTHEGMKHSPEVLYQYAPTEGSLPLRRAIAEKSGLEPSDIVITDGASQALFLILVNVADSNSTILMPRPTFPAYLRLAAYVDAKAASYDIDDACERTPKEPTLQAPNHIAIVNSPHNPTGRLIATPGPDELARTSGSESTLTILDDAYAWLDPTLNKPTGLARLIAEGYAADRAVAVGSLGKFLCLPGLRLGFVATKNVELREAVVEAKRHLVQSSCPTAEAYVTELLLSGRTPGIQKRIARELTRRRSEFEEFLRALGARPFESGHGFFVFANDTANVSRAGVLGIPGNVFDWSSHSARYCLAIGSDKWNGILKK